MTQTCTRNLTIWVDKKGGNRNLTYFRSASCIGFKTCRHKAQGLHFRSDETHQDRSKNNKKRRFIYIKFRCNDLLSLKYNLSIKSNNIYIWQLRLRIYTTFRWSIISQWGGRSRWEFKQFVVCNNIYNTDLQVWLGFSVLMCHAIQIFVPGSLDQLSVTALEDMFN